MGNKLTLKQCYHCKNRTFAYKGHYRCILISYRYYCMACDRDRLDYDAKNFEINYISQNPCQYLFYKNICNKTPTHAYGVCHSVFVCNKCDNSVYIGANNKCT